MKRERRIAITIAAALMMVGASASTGHAAHLLVGATGAAPSAAGALPPGWSLDTPLPQKRATVAAVRGGDGLIYVLSGSGTLDVFDPSTHVWSRRAPLPPNGGLGATVAESDEKIYVIDATTLGVYAPGTNRWASRAAPPIPRFDAAAVTGKDGKIYVMGGWKPNLADATVTLYARGLEVYDPKTNSWQMEAPMPTAREGLGAAVGRDGTIYAIGGGIYRYPRLPIIQCFAVVEAYNPRTNMWSKGPSLPRPACGVAAGTTANGTIVAVGGSTVTGGEQGSRITAATGTILALNPGGERWTALSRTPFPRTRAEAVVEPDGSVYVIGGADRSGQATATVQRYWKGLLHTSADAERRRRFAWKSIRTRLLSDRASHHCSSATDGLGSDLGHQRLATVVPRDQ